MKKLLSVALLMFSCAAFAQGYRPCETQNNTGEMNDCAKLKLDEKDKALNAAYQKLMKSLGPKDEEDEIDFKAVRKQLQDAQRAWINYRDNDCKAKYALAGLGSIRNLTYLGCLAQRTEQRTRELERWIEE